MAGLVRTARAPRTDRIRAPLLLWGGWLLATGVVFSQMQGIFHAYYTVALAPAVGALVGIGAVLPSGRWFNLVLAAWTGSDAPVLAYMDVDLSTDLAAVLPLVAPLISGHSDLAIGTRLARGSRVVRGPKRELIARGYNLLLRRTLAASFSDAQCGFKAIRADVAGRLLPLVRDTGWFFDTELLVLAQRAGLRIHEVPVDWVDDPDSGVDIVATALADLRGIARLGRGLATGAGLFRLGVGAQVANLLALLVTAVANTAANRPLTFGVRGSAGLGRHHLQGL